MTRVAEGGSDSVTSSERPVWNLWREEVEALGHFLKIADLHVTRLVPGWESEDNKWHALRAERDRILAIKTSLGWLSTYAAARVDRRLAEAVDVIDNETSSKVSTAALRLSEAEFLVERAWRSRYWNTWSGWRAWLPSLGRPAWLYIAVPLLCALGGTAYVIYEHEFFPNGSEVSLRHGFLGAALWGLAGAIVAALRTLHHRIQTQDFEICRLVWYFVSPIIGLTFGAIACLLFLMGLLTAGELNTAQSTPVGDTGEEISGTSAIPGEGSQPDDENPQGSQNQGDTQDNAGRSIDPTPILVLAVLAGFAQNSFLGTLQQMINARFRGQEEE